MNRHFSLWCQLGSVGWKTIRKAVSSPHFQKDFFLHLKYLCYPCSQACDWNSRVLVRDFLDFSLSANNINTRIFCPFQIRWKGSFYVYLPACLSILSVQNPENDYARLEHAFQEKKSQSQNSIQHFEFSRTFFSIGRPAILPAGPLLLDCQC